MSRWLRNPGTRNTSSRMLVALAAILLVLGSLAPEAALAAPKSRYTPARKFQRGISNTTLGILTIPGQMTAQTRERGAAVGLPLGFVMGLGWFVASEVVGVWELLTCPFPFPAGYKPILDPEFPWQFFEKPAGRSKRAR